MHLAAQPEKAAEAHDEWAPLRRIDVWTFALGYEQVFVDVQLHDMDFESIRGHIFAERAVIVDDALHLHGTLQHSGRSD